MPVFFFISGYFAEKSLCKCSMKEFCKKNNDITGTISFVIFYVLAAFLYEKEIFAVYTTYRYESLKDIAGGILCYAVSFIGIWAVMQASGYLKRIKIVETILSVTGQHSIDIYVIHMLLIKVIFFMPTALQENRISEYYLGRIGYQCD